MIDIEKQITHWKKGAEEDWEVAHDLVNQGRIRHGLFFAHLALEKVLKAHFCKYTRDLAPRIHRLPRLAELASLTLDPVQLEILLLMSTFNFEGRYSGI
ncbi:MAG: HEPN domain-containing protein [Chloroflexi bacterium]|nr:HEPN domain-containing protein [Chloroflexota bacterium]MBU1662490.1 HEPN domain-containing protein [Chloroflexota bacterium]